MSAPHAMDPCAKEKGCECAPAEFVRLRYFFGQRLGVVDLADEQSYFAGKQRFHNAHAHGAGVLCGLRAERYSFGQGTAGSGATTLLRVRRGAALDACGREIVVGWDQCIDVAAWFAQHPQAGAALGAGAALRLWVALCYRECPSDPAPAPRDPCGCDAGGCEFARIREGFQLLLLTDEQAKAIAAKPAAAQRLIGDARSNDASALHWARLVAGIGAADCPPAPDDPCLLLANFSATLDATGKKVADITAPDNTIEERLTLLPTWLLQQGLLRALQATGDAGLIATGPGWGALTFVNGGADSGTLAIDVHTEGFALARDPLDAPAQLAVTVSRFKDDGTWEAGAPGTVDYVAGPPARLRLQWTTGLVDGGRYRVLIEADHAQPPVDTLMRPLAPLSWARHFRLLLAGGVLVLAETLFA